MLIFEKEKTNQSEYFLILYGLFLFYTSKNKKFASPHLLFVFYFPDETPCWRKMFNWICGIENLTKSGVKKAVTRYEMRSIKENPIAKKVTNALAVLLMAIGMFFYGYFAWNNGDEFRVSICLLEKLLFYFCFCSSYFLCVCYKSVW